MQAKTGLVPRPEVVDALKLLKDWGTWLVGIQTAAIAALGVFAKDARFSPFEGALASVTAISFLISIFAATHLVVAIPAFMIRNRSLTFGEDLLDRAAFTSRLRWVEKIKVLNLVGLVQWPFLVGLFAFVALAIARVLGCP